MKKISFVLTLAAGLLPTVIPLASSFAQTSIQVKNQTNQPAPLPVANSEELRKIGTAAENHARAYANRLVEGFNLNLARETYNYILGIQAAEEQFSRTSLYRSKLQEGGSLGTTEGAAAGNKQGMKDGEMGLTAGKDEVTQQYRRAAVSSADAQSWRATLDSKPPIYPGRSFSNNQEVRMEVLIAQESGRILSRIENSQEDQYFYSIMGQRLTAFNNSLKHNILNRDLNFDTNILFRNNWSVSTMVTLLNDEQQRYYNNTIATSEKYRNASEVRNHYESAFLYEYYRVIDEKIIKQIAITSEEVQKKGYAAAMQALQTQAYNLGYNAQYEPAAKQAAQVAFAKSYQKNFEEAFAQREAYLKDNTEIEGIVAVIVDAKTKTEELVIGQPITLMIKELTNIGKKAATYKLSLKGAIQAQAEIQVKGLAKTTDVSFQEIAMISPAAKLGKQSVELCINNSFCAPVNFELKWETQIKALTKEGVSEKAADQLAQFIRGALLDEWKKIYKQNLAQYKSPYDVVLRDSSGRPTSPTPVVNPKSLLGQFDQLARKGVSNPAFLEKVLKISEDYLRMKGAMFSEEMASHTLRHNLSRASVVSADGVKKDLSFSEMTEEQKQEVLAGIKQRQEELYRWIESDKVVRSQMSDCWLKQTQSTGSCIGFLTSAESSTDNFRQVNLGQKFVEKLLSFLKTKTGDPKNIETQK